MPADRGRPLERSSQLSSQVMTVRVAFLGNDPWSVPPLAALASAVELDEATVEQIGKTIGEFQGVQFELAKMATRGTRAVQQSRKVAKSKEG